ncbi:MAG: hypothetical protein M0Z98_10140, partial [Actinomycetales bacterium]|nr:hypothetical protein [Actinomycetales bacterium]
MTGTTSLHDADADARADRRRAALAGGLAGASGLAAAELLGLVLPGRPSPVTSVADRVVATMPDGPQATIDGA